MPSTTLQRIRRYLLNRSGLASSREVAVLTKAHAEQSQRAAEDVRRVTKRLDRLEHKIEALIDDVDDILQTLRRGRLKKLDDNVDALTRHAFLQQALGPRQSILARRFRGLSQNEEDGITLALFERIGVLNRRFVEIGAGVNGGNSGYLARECGWSGVMFEINAQRVHALQRRFGPAVTAVAVQITRENIDALLTEHGASGEIDLLSVDIDGIDYWVWDSISVCRPRLVIVEYNPSFGPVRAVTVPYQADFDRHRFRVTKAAYYGASLAALTRLGARRGYRLVVVEPRGVNAFFLRDDLAGDLPALSVDQIAYAGERDDSPEPDALFAELSRVGLPLVEVS